MYFFAALKTKPSEQDIARSLCASIKALPRDPLAARIRVAIACRLQAGNAAASFEAVNNACKFASTKAKSAASRALQIKSSDDNGRRKRPPAPLRRRELRARSAARRPIPRYRWRQLSRTTPGLRAVAATLASESRRWQTRSMGRGALADASPRPNNTKKTQAWSRASSANAATTPASCGRTRSSRVLN